MVGFEFPFPKKLKSKIKLDLKKKFFFVDIKIQSDLCKQNMQAIQDVKINVLSDVISTPCMFGVYQTLRYCSVESDGEHTRFDIENPATLFPMDAKIVGFFVDSAGNTFVYTDDLYKAKMEYSLHDTVPKDSVLYAFVFKNRQGRTVVGIFDTSRVNGHCLMNLTCIERFKFIHSVFKKRDENTKLNAGSLPGVYLHWVGHEGVLMDMMKNRKQKELKVDFDVDCVLRLSDELLEHSTCCKLLTQDPIVNEVPTLSTVKMYARLHKKS